MPELVTTFVPDRRAYLDQETPEYTIARLRRHERTGRPLGERGFVGRLEQLLGRNLHRHRAGPKPQAQKKGN